MKYTFYDASMVKKNSAAKLVVNKIQPCCNLKEPESSRIRTKIIGPELA